MFTIELEVTRKCNLMCEYCFEEKGEEKVLTIEEALRRVEFALGRAEQLGIFDIYIDFTGGEPLLALDTIKNIVYILERNKYKKFSFQYGLVTNGVLFNERVKEFLQKYNFDVTLSLDGDELSHDVNRKLKNGMGSYFLIEKNIDNLLGYNKKVAVNMVIASNNYRKFFNNFSYIINKGFKIIRTKLDINSVWSEKEMEILKKELDRAAELYFNLNKNGQIVYWDFIEEGVEAISGRVDNYFCGSGIISLYITVNGGIKCCSVCEQTGTIGSMESGIDEEEIKKLSKYSRKLQGKCKECNISAYCPQCDCIFLNKAFSENEKKLEKYCKWYQIRYELSRDIMEKVKNYRRVGLK